MSNWLQYSGLRKLIEVVSSTQKIAVPFFAHPATQLIHSRARFALNEFADELRLANFQVLTSDAFSYGNTILRSVIFKIYFRPGQIYNRLMIIPDDPALIFKPNSEPYYNVSFVEFLRDPGAFFDAIQHLINVRFAQYMSGRVP